MADYHTVYKGPEGHTTQWEDIQVKLGNMPARPKAWKPEAFTPEVEERKDTAWLAGRDEDELRDAQDEFADDRFLEDYRQKRIRELQQAQLRPRFGTMDLIRGSEFVQQVTNADPEVWVVVFLFKEGHAGCRLLGQCLDELAAKHAYTRFVRIVSTDCIPNYPDSNLPTLLLYHAGSCLKTLVGLAPYGGKAGITPEQVSLVLNTLGPFCRTEDEDADAVAASTVKSLVQRLVAQRDNASGGGAGGGDQEHHDESSDFDDI